LFPCASLDSPFFAACQTIAISPPVVVLHIDCKNATVEQVEHVDTTIQMPINAGAAEAALHGFVGWFDVTFTGPAGLAGHQVLSREPGAGCLHFLIKNRHGN
jgi:hypothetical protein